ncbi:MAG: hypothetical protein HZA17_01100 [Nitrospirae bacterium]|nr:hypothetical protein [Nitrospirota bacterium]
MKKRFNFSILFTACLLFLFALSSLVSVEGAVLCFGPDGHVAIEFVDACHGTGLGSKLVGAEGDACGPCKDVQFLGSPAYTSNTSHNTQIIPLAALSQTLFSLPSKEYPGKHGNPPDCSHHKTLTSMHSVVLLI